MIRLRKPDSAKIKKSKPEMNIPAKHCHAEYPYVNTTVQVKNAFIPIPGHNAAG